MKGSAREKLKNNWVFTMLRGGRGKEGYAGDMGHLSLRFQGWMEQFYVITKLESDYGGG